MGSSSSEEEYAAFEEKVKRTIYLDNLSPQVTEPVLTTALNQFGNVKTVQFVPNYLMPKNIPSVAPVEMEDAEQAEGIIVDTTNFPLMMSGLPRPVRAQKAVSKMFHNRPKKPGIRIFARWLDPEDPAFETAEKIIKMTRKHTSEASFLLEQLGEEEKLHEQQLKSLKDHYRKYELIDNAQSDVGK